MLRVVADTLRRRGTSGWLVGGGVRDIELGRFSPDLDIVVLDDPRAVARDIARSLDAPWFVLSERHPAYRVMGPEGHVDVAAVKGGGIRADLAERDFTVNAMAIPIGSDGLIDGPSAVSPEVLLDPFGGLRDLGEKRLVAVSDHVFADDPLRMMRAVRFRHVLGLELDAALRESIRAHAHLLAGTAAERVSAELALTLAEGGAGEAVSCWDDLGLLRVLLPEVPPRGISAAVAMLARLDVMLDGPGMWLPEVTDPLAGRLARPVDGALSRPVVLRLAALTHGLSPDEAGRVGRSLKLSADAVSLLVTASRFGGRQSRPQWPSLPPSGPAGREAVLFMWRAAPWEPEVIILVAAATAAASDTVDLVAGLHQALEPAQGLLRLWADRTQGHLPPLPVDGNGLMEHLDLSGGPKLGAILREVRLAWEAGEISSAAEALALARSSADREA